ncbi:MAG: hypothetical protein PQJ50_13665 [Spirochaetales bacterium]|nr:hypothetical protein [Spirochaetales bacterium]
MYFLVIEIFDSNYKEEIYLALQSVGIQKAVTFDARNLNSALSDEQTFFTGFFRSDKIGSGAVEVIQARVSEKGAAKEFLSNLKESGAPVEKENIVALTLFPAAASFTSETGLQES